MDITHHSESELTLRIPPQSIEAETSLIGALLLDCSKHADVNSILKASDFYRDHHGVIFNSIEELIGQGEPVDVITVFEQIKKTGHDESGQISLAALNKIAQYVPSASNVVRYAEIVKQKSILRSLISASNKIAEQAYAQSASVDDILQSAEKSILEVGHSIKSNAGYQSLEALGTQFIDDLQDRVDNPSLYGGVRSGFYALDEALGGFQPGELIVAAGRPSMGKTSFVMNIAESASLDQNLPVLIISLEMKSSALYKRMVGSIGGVNQTKIRDAKGLTDSDWADISKAVEKTRNKAMDFEEAGVENIGSIRSAARRALQRHSKLGLVVIDYLQLLDGDSTFKSSNRNEEISKISRGLKLLAQELNCPIVALSQLNRSVESRADKRPVLSDLRESGAIEQDADTIIFIYRDDYYTKEQSKEPGVAEIIVAKARNGETGTVRLGWQKEYTRFTNMASSYPD
jgi:replicative DNA helicase